VCTLLLLLAFSYARLEPTRTGFTPPVTSRLWATLLWQSFRAACSVAWRWRTPACTLQFWLIHPTLLHSHTFCCCFPSCLRRVEPTRAGFHTPSHIFPLGYTASAKFPSSVQPGVEVAYTCMVADGGPAGPLFVVVVPDAPGQQWLGPTPDAVWQQVQQRVSTEVKGCEINALQRFREVQHTVYSV
jgi:hypothetical protein